MTGTEAEIETETDTETESTNPIPFQPYFIPKSRLSSPLGSQPKEIHQIPNRQPPQFPSRPLAQRAVRQVLFAILESQDALLDRVGDDRTSDGDGAGLTNTMASVPRL